MSTADGVPSSRSRGIAATIEGFFAFMWFGWGQAAAPLWVSVALGFGSVASALVSVAGIALTVRSTGQHTRMRDPGLIPLGGLIMAVAVAALIVGLVSSLAPSPITGPGTGICLLGAAILTLTGRLGPAVSQRPRTMG